MGQYPRVVWSFCPGSGLGPQAGVTGPSWVPAALPQVRNGKGQMSVFLTLKVTVFLSFSFTLNEIISFFPE